MPRANRCFLPNHVWHITHRCHKKEFLLKALAPLAVRGEKTFSFVRAELYRHLQPYPPHST